MAQRSAQDLGPQTEFNSYSEFCEEFFSFGIIIEEPLHSFSLKSDQGLYLGGENRKASAMGTGRSLIALLYLGTEVLSGQIPSNSTAQTVPTPIPNTADSSLTDGILTPEVLLPSGFSFRADKLDLAKLLAGDTLELDAEGNIRVKTNHGDTLTSRKARLDFNQSAESAVSFHDNVQLRATNGIEVFADRASIDQNNDSILFEGNVSAYQGTALHRGDQVTYNYESRSLATSNLRTSFAPVLLESGRFSALEQGERKIYKGTNAGITTHDVANPNFWLRGEEVTVLPGDRIRFRNLKVYAGGRPVLWLPGLTQKFDGEFNYRPTPGVRSNWGPYLLNQYTHDFGGIRDPTSGITEDPTHEVTWRADLYGRRGLGVGLDLNSYAKRDNPNLGTISGYFIYDLNPSIRRSAESRLGFNDNERYSLQVRQRAETNILPGGTGYVDLNTTLLSDRFFIEDFRPSDNTRDFQPDNTLSFTQAFDERHLLTAWTRFRLNDFFQSDQRLPEIAFDQVRSPLFGTPILHESQNSIGIYREDLADFVEDDLRDEFENPTTDAARRSQIQGLLADTGFARFHTYHELSLPIRLDPGLNIIPRVGVGHTAYRDVQGPLDSFSRSHVHASIDASLKFTKRYPDWVSEKWGLDSALHIIQPYATATVLATDDLDADFRPIDRLTASTRPRALNPGRFAAIDDFADWQILRVGARNRILTQRNGSSHEWLSVDTYLDIFGEDPEFDRQVSNLYTDLRWSPLPWFDLTVETQLPLFSDSNFTEVTTGFEFLPNEDTEISVRHRFLQDHPILSDSNRLELNAYYRLNEQWGVSATQRWEFADDTLEFQQYSLHRSLDSWSLTAGIFTRDNSDQTEFGLLFGLTLSDFPSLSLPLQIDN